MRPKRLRPDTKRIKWKGEPSRRLRSSRKLLLLLALFFSLALALSLTLLAARPATASNRLSARLAPGTRVIISRQPKSTSVTSKAIPRARNHWKPFSARQIYYLNLRRADQARAHYQEILNQEPSHPNARVARERMAEIMAELGRSYEAIGEYEKLHPQDEKELRRIRLRIADLYFDQKNYSQALTEYEKVTQADYDELSEQAHLREASIYHIARGQHQQALPIYKKLADSSSDPEVRLRAAYAIADCYAGLYQFEEAIKTLREIKIDSEQSLSRGE